MSKAINDLVALMPNARPERVANNVFDITVPIAEADALNAAIVTLQVFGADAIAYYVYEFGDIRVRVTFRSGHAEPLIFYANKLRGDWMHMPTIPFISDTSETWGLELPAANAARLAELLADHPRVVWRRARWSEDNLVLYRSGGADDGSYAVVDNDKATPTIDYYLRFTPIHLPQIGRAIEVRMWRSNFLTSLSTTREILMERLLHAHGSIVSSPDLTASGFQHAWSKQMAAAANVGMTVGFMDQQGELCACDDPQHFHGWYNEHSQGGERSMRERVYIIASADAFGSPCSHETVSAPVECWRPLSARPFKRHLV